MNEEKDREQNVGGFSPTEGEPIRIEEEDLKQEETAGETGQTWTEEFTVAGEELVETVRRLVREAGVRRIVVKNKEKRILFEIPIVLGVAGIALLPTYTALALGAALLTDCTIAVERVAEDA